MLPLPSYYSLLFFILTIIELSVLSVIIKDYYCKSINFMSFKDLKLELVS